MMYLPLPHTLHLPHTPHPSPLHRVNHSKNAIVKPQGPTAQETKRDVDEAMKKVKETMMAIEASVVVPEVEVPVVATRGHQRHDDAEIPTAMFLAAPAIALANGASKPMGHTAPPQDPTSQETKRDVDEAMKKVKEAMMAIEARVVVPEVQVPVAAIRRPPRT
ncbi:uncharacterized protein LOC135334588 [Halichondria panicea]|uniref:uncharacterized protein LOC135334588 n=1 Tax=Halichondria panicea TaxID=6063 RepID=UPI00312B7C1C